MLGYFILTLVGVAIGGYFLIKWGVACECECHDDDKFFKCDDSCECECHDDHLYACKTKVIGYFTGLYNKIKRK